MATYNGEIVSGKGQSLTIYAGDLAYNTIVRNSAALRVSAGGYVETTTVYNSAVLSHAGTAAATFLSGGTMMLSSGGTANGVSVLRNAKLTVLEGGIATDVYVSSGSINATVRGGDYVTRIDGNNEFGSFSLQNGVATNFLLNSTAQLTVSGGGSALNPTINRGGMLTVSVGGTALGIVQNIGGKLNTTIRGGDRQTIVSGTNVSGAFLLSGGVASDFILYENAAQYVSNGGISLNTLVSNSWAHQFVYSGGIASATKVYHQGSMTIYDGGIARGTVVYSGGSMMPTGGDVSGATIYGKLLVSSANTGDDESGGISTLSDITIASGGIMKVLQKANFKNTLTAAGNIELADTMTLLDGISLVLDVSERDSCVEAILSDWGKVDANANYSLSISVGVTPKYGSYKLADNAAGFATAITVTSGATPIGMLTVGGEFVADRRSYSLALDDSALTLSIAVADGQPTKEDLNNNGRADIVMSIVDQLHPYCGATGAWLIQGNDTAAWGDLSQRSEGWEIFGIGCTAAGKSTNDIYIKSSDNVVGAWMTNADGKVTGWKDIESFDSATQVLGIGDFNGDGQSDLLLRNVNGAVGCYFTSGDTTGWNYFQSLGDEWTVTAVGDLNSDGRDDVVLKHDAGFAGSWLTQDDYTMAWENLDTLPDGFAIVGTGDFDGDGTSDVLLQNGTYYGAWIVRNGNAARWFGIGDLGDITVEQIADFNGDGRDDLRIRTTGGDLGAQLVRGADNLEWKYYGSVGSEWSTSLAAI